MKKEEIGLIILKEENQMIKHCHKVQQIQQKKPTKKEKIFKWGAVWKCGKIKFYKY